MSVNRANAGLVDEQWLGTTVRCYAGRPETIVELLHLAAGRFPDSVAVHDGDVVVTYREFSELVEGAAATLRSRGLAPGDRVAVAFRNSLDSIIAIWACARAGLVFVGLPTRQSPATWTYVLQHAAPALVLSHPEFHQGVLGAAREAGLDPDRVREVGDLLTGTAMPWRGTEIAFPHQDSHYATVYTSGTTGRPKAIALIHRGTVHSAICYVREMGLVEGDRTAITFPLYYVTGHVAQVSTMMFVGGTSVPVVELSAADLILLIRERQISYVMVTPSLWPLLLRESGFQWPELGHLRIGAFGGSPVPVSTIAALRERMPQLRLFDAYGLSETHSPATILLDHEFERHPGSVGRPVPCADVRVIEPDGTPVPPGGAGELLIRGPMITSGYVGDAAATAAGIRDGWLHTGDLCRIDDEGYVYLLDRIKDVIIRGGYKVYSVELEYLLVSHPKVQQAAAFGIPDKLAFESVAVYVVAADGVEVTARELRSFVKERLADYAVPRHVRIVSEIPRNRTGKIEKSLLRQTLLAELQGAGD